MLNKYIFDISRVYYLYNLNKKSIESPNFGIKSTTKPNFIGLVVLTVFLVFTQTAGLMYWLKSRD